jgi:antitoxin ParD1/3/4
MEALAESIPPNSPGAPMTFSLTAELENLIRRKVTSGSYDSPAQVVEEALMLLEERDHLRALRRDQLLRELADGVFQADNRQLVEGAQVFQGLVNKARATDE